MRALPEGLLGQLKINLIFCICNYPDLCYRVFIPVVAVSESSLHVGSNLRHWPPGTNS